MSAVEVRGKHRSIFYVHTDHLNTPRKVSRPSDNKLEWRWDADPFGTAAINQNPAGLGTFLYNLRFPGQYYMAETGLNYNWNRDYDPLVGGYIESDPIGLNGGVNTYAYGKADPVESVDRNGLLQRGGGIDDWDAVRNAETVIRQELAKSCICHKNGSRDSCILCDRAQQISDIIATAWVLGSTNLGPNTCGTGERSGIIRLAPQAFTNKECGGCLASVIYHELLHVIGIPDEDTPDKGPGAYTSQKQCIGHLCKGPLQ